MSRRGVRVEVQGYGVLRELAVTLAPLTILVGPNGSGKTTLLNALESALSCELGKEGLVLSRPVEHWRHETYMPVRVRLEGQLTIPRFRLLRVYDERPEALTYLEAMLGELGLRECYEALVAGRASLERLEVAARRFHVLRAEVAIDVEGYELSVEVNLVDRRAVARSGDEARSVDFKAACTVIEVFSKALKPFRSTYDWWYEEADRLFVYEWISDIREAVSSYLKGFNVEALALGKDMVLRDVKTGVSVAPERSGLAVDNLLTHLLAIATYTTVIRRGDAPPITCLENPELGVYPEKVYDIVEPVLNALGEAVSKRVCSPMLLETHSVIGLALPLHVVASLKLGEGVARTYLFYKDREGGHAVEVGVGRDGVLSLPEEARRGLQEMGCEESLVMGEVSRRARMWLELLEVEAST